MNNLSQQQRQDVRDILAWIRGGDITPNPDMEEKFISTLTGIVKDRIDNPVVEVQVQTEQPRPRRTNPYGDRPHPLSLKAIMREVTGDENYELPKIEVCDYAPKIPVQTEEELDSVTLAKVLVHLSKESGHGINMSQLQIMLYIAYGVHLAKEGKRLTDEHPQMWEYGPVFPKAYNKLRKTPSDGESEAKNLESRRPEIYSLLSNCFQRFAWTSATALTTPHTAAGSPWAQTRKKSPEKWGAQIDDTIIQNWFKERI